jgi:phosphoserine phosphatase
MASVVIFDLDGTILRTNSFRVWVVYLLRAQFPHLGRGQRLRIATATAFALFIRKLGLIDHETLKWRLQAVWRRATDGNGGAVERDFVDRLRQYVRPELSGILNAVAEREIDAVMSTAAVADYADSLGRSLGFQHILATAADREKGEPSNVGWHKRDAVLSFLADHGWRDRARIFFTDHREDLPLIRLCQIVYWFGADAERVAIAGGLPGVLMRPGLREGELLQSLRRDSDR